MAIGIGIGTGFSQLLATSAFIAAFSNRVQADGGTSESYNCLSVTINNLKNL